MERGGDLGQCIVAIEDAAAREGLGWLKKPMGRILEEGENGKWVEISDEVITNGSNTVPEAVNGNSNGMIQTTNGASTTTGSTEKTNGVPTYGEDPITSTEEFLRKYRDVMEKKLASIDEKLEELDNKASGSS